jgi:hypothetical protein
MKTDSKKTLSANGLINVGLWVGTLESTYYCWLLTNRAIRYSLLEKGVLLPTVSFSTRTPTLAVPAHG